MASPQTPKKPKQQVEDRNSTFKTNTQSQMEIHLHSSTSNTAPESRNISRSDFNLSGMENEEIFVARTSSDNERFE